MQHVSQTAAIAEDLGLDTRGIALRKSFLEFGTTDFDHLRAIHGQLESQRADFAAAFYDYFLSFDELRARLPGEAIERLKKSLSAYFKGYYPRNLDRPLTAEALEQHLRAEMTTQA